MSSGCFWHPQQGGEAVGPEALAEVYQIQVSGKEVDGEHEGLGFSC